MGIGKSDTMKSLKEFLIAQYEEPDHYRGDEATTSNSVTYRNLQNELIGLHRDKMNKILPSEYPLTDAGLDAAGMDYVNLSLSAGLEWVVASVLHGVKPDAVAEEDWDPLYEADYVRKRSGRYEIINHPNLESELFKIGHTAETFWTDFARTCAWYEGEKDHLNHNEDYLLMKKYRIHLEALHATLLNYISSKSDYTKKELYERGLIAA